MNASKHIDPAIQVRNLTKSYGPDQLTFSVPRGVISGFLGPNGAGKTTTIRILMGMAHAGGGTTRILGEDRRSPVALFDRVAFVPESKDLYPFARAGEMIHLTRGFYPRWDHELERRLIDMFEIRRDMWCAKLSRGQRTKLTLLLALCRRAELLVLDEPTEGLDPVGIEQTLRLLVEEVAEHGATVFFSSHQLPEVEQIADHVVMIRRGRCVVEGGLDQIREQSRRVRCLVENDNATLPGVAAGWHRDGRFLTGFSSEPAEALASKLEASGIQLIESEPATLKEIFFEQMVRS
jgi:ABC-2 type transport system ATP-binding protein